MKVKLNLCISPKSLAESCQNSEDRCTTGLFECPFANSTKQCKDIKEKDWDKFLRENLDMDSLFRS